MEKIFLSKNSKIKLVVGDVVREECRFTKSYVLYQITKIDEDYCELLILDTSGWGRKGNKVSGQISCFYGGHKTKYLTYYIPAGKVLYGHKTTTTTP